MRELALLIAFALLFSGCAQKAKAETGTLQGTVTLGPLCPVEPCQVTPAQKGKALEAVLIIAYDRQESVVIKETSPDENGNYKLELEPGIYRIDTNRFGIGSVSGVPKDVVIEAGKMVTLDIRVDTGIR